MEFKYPKNTEFQAAWTYQTERGFSDTQTRVLQLTEIK
jgi:hypothetical protein